MDELRSLIQQKLEEIQDIEVSAEVPDDILEEGKTYFSYSLSRFYDDGDLNRNYIYRVVLTGFIKRINDAEENTLEIVDNAQDLIASKLKELNIKCDFEDVSILDNIRKTRVNGRFKYYELTKGIV